ncbi:PrsW family glutamic-type intramembrane protease [Amnibacterium sp. CER49]|uniref:PrsW family intramembrane metalloprotease n=1 Tax=Amnibacterium sp. CER49 TaxID=3039161 RepID=UPI00244D1BD3|nr:PrsW family glutamic-type intramembrane protease [Amnibacterium sp. CER49]MDH2443538.1 PrsW family glutamic-type intramembrane protease [Amnibacterium sp. CER49]
MTASEESASILLRDGPERTRRHGWWWKALLAGIALWIASTIVTASTLNVNLIPTLILLGSFVVPFSVVLFAAERVNGSFTGSHLMVAFFVSGVLGVLGASLLEVHLSQNLFTFLAVGFIEEFVKGVLLFLVGRSLVPKTARQGALLGAVVGAGFAAFESAGYAFSAALTGQGIDLQSLLQTEVIRAVLTPLGHVLWTAVLGAAIFAASRDGRRYRFTIGVVVAYVVVSVLHGLWDSMGAIGAVVAVLVTGNRIVPALVYGFVRPGTAAEVSSLSTAFYVVGLAVISLIGLVVLTALVRHHRRRDVSVLEQHHRTPLGV